MKTTKWLLIFASAVLMLTSCKKKGGVFCYSATGDQVIETRDVSNFSSIDLSMDADVYFQQSNEYSVEVHASENLQDIIQTKVKGNRLSISLKNKKCLKGDSDVEVYVTAPDLSKLSISGTGTVYSLRQFNCSSLDVNISGSGELEFDSLACQDFSADISGSGEIYLMGTGTSDKQTIDISGSGCFKGFEMPTLESKINISGSGNCEVNVVNSINARISGSGEVRYKGNPSIDSNISGSGSIKKY